MTVTKKTPPPSKENGFNGTPLAGLGESIFVPKKTKTTILADAAATIAGPREQEYGSKLQNFTQIAMMVQGYLAPKLLPDSRITPEDIAMIMITVKMARLAKSPDHKDSILDVAGYAGCFDELQLQRAAEVPLLGATVDPRSKS